MVWHRLWQLRLRQWLCDGLFSHDLKSRLRPKWLHNHPVLPLCQQGYKLLVIRQYFPILTLCEIWTSWSIFVPSLITVSSKLPLAMHALAPLSSTLSPIITPPSWGIFLALLSHFFHSWTLPVEHYSSFR